MRTINCSALTRIFGNCSTKRGHSNIVTIVILILVFVCVKMKFDTMKSDLERLRNIVENKNTKETVNDKVDAREVIQTVHVDTKVEDEKPHEEVMDIDSIMKSRKRQLEEACAKNGDRYIGYNSDGHVRKRILVDTNQNIAYCAIQKIGSTFLKRLLMVATGRSSAQNPFDINANAVGRAPLDHLSDLDEKEIQPFMQQATSFLFVREPYARLFSGYVDKLFSPNAIYWGITGTYAIKLVRKDADSVSLNCGHDLSFAEFIKYVIHAEETNIKRNGHFSPAYDHCHPCNYRYDIVGKLETMKADTLYILDKMGNTELKERLSRNFSSSTADDTILDQTKWLFGLRKRYVGCMSFFEAQRRMWKKFQMRGYISTSSKYPVSKYNSEKITEEQYMKYVHEGLGDAKDKVIAKRNKEEAMLEAYSTVDKQDLEKLRQLLEPDCELFGYNCKPDKIFNQKEIIKPWYFDIETA